MPVLLLLLLLLLGHPCQAQEPSPSPDAQAFQDQSFPPDDPFLVHNRVNLFFDNSVKPNREGKQQIVLNPVFSLDEDGHTSLSVTIPVGWYQGGLTGNLNTQGMSDVAFRLFRRVDTDEETSHGFGLAMTYDTGVLNLGGAQTVVAVGYAYEHQVDDNQKFVLIAEDDNSVGQSQPGNPTRQLVLRLQGYRYFDDAYLGLELRNQYDLTMGSYQPLAVFSVGGEVVEGLQLWGSFRLPLNQDARVNNDRIHYSVGVTVPY